MTSYNIFSERIYVQITDPDSNQDPNAAEPLAFDPIIVWNSVNDDRVDLDAQMPGHEIGQLGRFGGLGNAGQRTSWAYIERGTSRTFRVGSPLGEATARGRHRRPPAALLRPVFAEHQPDSQ